MSGTDDPPAQAPRWRPAAWVALAAATGFGAGAVFAWSPRLLASMPETLLLFPGLCH